MNASGDTWAMEIWGTIFPTKLKLRKCEGAKHTRYRLYDRDIPIFLTNMYRYGFSRVGVKTHVIPAVTSRSYVVGGPATVDLSPDRFSHKRNDW